MIIKHLRRLFFKEHKESFYTSQKGQDSYLLNTIFKANEYGLKRNGYFIDLACADGVNLSNTYVLEKHLGWKGLLIDANPKYRESIISNRSSTYLDYCVSDRDNEIIKFRIDNGMLSGIVSDDFDNNKKTRGTELKNAEIIKLKTKTLTSILNECKAPELIDFMSLDIEGAELPAIKGLDFSKYLIMVICIERPNLELALLLDKLGYRQIKFINQDMFFVHEQFENNYGFKVTSEENIFQFTARKTW